MVPPTPPPSVYGPTFKTLLISLLFIIHLFSRKILENFSFFVIFLWQIEAFHISNKINLFPH